MPKHPDALIANARALRRESTDSEQRLWRHLRGRQLEGLRFRRQHALGPFIADLVCDEAKLIIEADGGQHAEQAKADARRTAWLEGQRYRVLRFWNNDILQDTGAVLEEIRRVALERVAELRGATPDTAPHPSPLPRGERE